MKISTKGRYGLRAMLDLAKHTKNGETVSVQSISERQNISESYLEQLVSLLKKAGLIESVRGANGGYRLSRDESQISVGDILRACEGDIEVVSCSAKDTEESCNQSGKCAAKVVWEAINNAIESAVDGIMLSSLTDESLGLSEEDELDTEKCIN